VNLSAQEINSQFLMLSEQEQQKVVDFVLSQQTKYLRKRLKPNNETPIQTEGERVLAILERGGLLGCMEGGEENLSENYKAHLWGNE
jgi:hypothetical protein